MVVILGGKVYDEVSLLDVGQQLARHRRCDEMIDGKVRYPMAWVEFDPCPLCWQQQQ